MSKFTRELRKYSNLVGDGQELKSRMLDVARNLEDLERKLTWKDNDPKTMKALRAEHAALTEVGKDLYIQVQGYPYKEDV
jgi:hypothetical protein